MMREDRMSEKTAKDQSMTGFMKEAEAVYGKDTQHNLQLLFDAWIAGYEYGCSVTD